MNESLLARMIRVVSAKEFLIGASFGVIGVATAVYLNTADDGPFPWTEPGRSSSFSASDGRALEQLQSALEAEVLAREELATRIVGLEESLLRLTLAAGGSAGDLSIEIAANSEDPDSEEGETEGSTLASGAKAESSQFDDQLLLALGAHSSDVDRLHDRWVSHELDKEAIANQALREGWFQKPRHRGELIGLELALRRDLQDEDYDRYLYALGKPNRLEAGEILAGSSASDAGLRRGDVILRYDDVRMFGPGELLVASSTGVSGTSVSLEVLRDGRRRTLYVSRGPLGALIEHSWAAPFDE